MILVNNIMSTTHKVGI